MQSILILVNQMIEGQKARLLKVALEIVPHVTDEDLLQPNDFPDLEENPYFRYEEGVLHGLLSCQSGLQAVLKKN